MVVISTDGKLSCKSYARWLMEQHLGRELTSDETVDHIDEDKLNDDISNLQVLSLADNIHKSSGYKQYPEYTCPLCGNTFRKWKAQVDSNRRQGKPGPFCTKSCAMKWKYHVAR